MLEYWYKERRTLVDFRRGPLKEIFDGFAGRIKEMGYSKGVAKQILGKSCLFNDWLIDNNINDCRSIDKSSIESFLDEYFKDKRSASKRYCPRLTVSRELLKLVHYLVEIEMIQPFPPDVAPAQPHTKILIEFLQHLKESTDLSESTIDKHRRMTDQFLKGLSATNISNKEIFIDREMMDKHIKKFLISSPENLRSLSSSVRKFLKFCSERKYTSTDFSGLVPSVPSYKHAELPRGIEDSSIEHMLDSIDRKSHKGARDYAMIMLMMAYGIRAISVGKLYLEDIRWQNSTIRIRAQKGGKEVILPLLDAVGESIIGYLRKRPEATSFREVFLSVKAPFNTLNSCNISGIVRKHMELAGVKVHRSGTSTLRHSWAIRALAHDSPIKAIADVLGHRHIDTTFIYAKADLKMLRHVATPWPGEK